MPVQFTKPSLGDLVTKTVIIGDNGDGKSTSALRVATGMAGGGKILVIDTDNGRASLNAGRFDFLTYRLGPPYNGDHYAAAIDEAVKLKPAVLIIDTVSEEQAEMLRDHDRYLDERWERECKRPGGPRTPEWQFREKFGMSAWGAAKEPRKNLLYKLRAIRCELIVTMRCGLRTNPDTYKSEMALEGYTRFCSDATATFLLKPNSNGVPNWSPPPELSGCTKMISAFRDYDPNLDWSGPLSERHGEVMAAALRGEPQEPPQLSTGAEAWMGIVHSSPDKAALTGHMQSIANAEGLSDFDKRSLRSACSQKLKEFGAEEKRKSEPPPEGLDFDELEPEYAAE